MDYVVEMTGIKKIFPGIIANDNVDFKLKKGEIHAILGENGAGKSTLMSILFGLYPPDKGDIFIKGEKVKINNPNDANNLGIGMVHQHFKLIHNFTVTENIILGREDGFVFNKKKAEDKIKSLSDKYGLFISPDSIISDITVGMQQRVEILKMLYRDADILIFDEPTAVLTPQEISELMQIIKSLAAEGKAIILITHKLQEILEVADRCTIIRKGKFIDVVDVPSTSKNELASKMVGRDVNFKVDKKPSNPTETILSIKNLCVKKEKRVRTVDDFSLDVRAGEIVGIAGVDGNGQSELVYALAGLMPIESGSILLNDKDISKASVRQRNEQGLGHIPEDRQKHGLVLQYSLTENMAIKSYYKEEFQKGFFLKKDKMEAFAQEIVDNFDVRSGKGIDSAAGTLSGGEQQMLAISRALMGEPKVLMLDEPSLGLAPKIVGEVFETIVRLKEEGITILLVEQNAYAALKISDHAYVLENGKIVMSGDAKEMIGNDEIKKKYLGG